MWWLYLLVVISFGLSVTAIVFALTTNVAQEIRSSNAVRNEINSVVRTNPSVVRNTAKTPLYPYCKGSEIGNIDFASPVTKYLAGDRVLLSGQQNPIENGVYQVIEEIYLRSPELASDTQVKPGALVYAGGELFVLNSPGPFSNTATVTAPLSFTNV